MPQPLYPAITLRAVRGRVVDPFRGSLESDSAERFASRAVDLQPFDDVIARLAAVPGVKLSRAGRRFTLKRNDERVKVSFASASRFVSLDDTTLEGDGALALAVAHALMPLFGAVEVRIGGFHDLLDGHEPEAVVAKRYEDWYVADSLRVAEQLQARDAAQCVAAAQHAQAQADRVVRRRRRTAMIACAVMLLMVGAGIVLSFDVMVRAEVGEACTKPSNCSSNACLPRQPVSTIVIGDTEIPSYVEPKLADVSGVCTRSCSDDRDCPRDMRCGPVMSYQFGLGHRATSCIPRAWTEMR